MSSPDVGAVVLSSYICLFLAYLALSFFPDWPLLSLPPAVGPSPTLSSGRLDCKALLRGKTVSANTGDCSTLRRARCLGLMLDDCRNCSLSSEAQVKQQETGCSTLSPLATAVSRGHLEVVVELLQWPTLRINEILQDGNTALHCLALSELEENQQVEVLRALLSSPRLYPELVNKDGVTAFHLFVMKERWSAMALLANDPRLVQKVILLATQKESILHWACRHNLTEAVKIVLSSLSSSSFPANDFVNSLDEQHETALDGVIRRGQNTLLKVFLESSLSIDFNGYNKNGRTPLQESVLRNDRSLVKLLLAPSYRDKVDINSQDKFFGWTALHFACEWGFEEIVLLLLSHPSLDINRQSSNNKTALHWATKKGQVRIVRLLLDSKHGVDVDVLDQNGRSALTIATDEEITQLLRKRGAQAGRSW
eukprot:gene9858-10905_t